MPSSAAATTTAVRVLRLMAFAWAAISVLLGLLTFIGTTRLSDASTANSLSLFLQAVFVIAQGLIVWAFLTVVADIADDVRAMRSRD